MKGGQSLRLLKTRLPSPPALKKKGRRDSRDTRSFTAFTKHLFILSHPPKQKKNMSSTGDNIGMMEGAFFVGRKAILDWINEHLELNLGRIEECCAGSIACQICDSLYPGKVNMSKVSVTAHKQVAPYPHRRAPNNNTKITFCNVVFNSFSKKKIHF